MRGKWIAGLCAGAALGVAPAAFAQSATERAPIQVVDQRPADELKTSWLSLMITSCEYGIRRVADEKGAPSRLDGLRADLEAALGAPLAGKTITVTRYGSYFNTGAYNRGVTYSKFGGLIPDLMSTMGSKCAREDTKAGWYQGSEVTNISSPIIVELTASVDGKSYETRSVYSPETELNPFFSKDKNAPAALGAALKKANAALIAQISADVAPGVAAPAPAPTTAPPLATP
jgi:hypothetical protein